MELTGKTKRVRALALLGERAPAAALPMAQDAAAALEGCRPVLLVVDAASAEYATLAARCASLRHLMSLGAVRHSYGSITVESLRNHSQ